MMRNTIPVAFCREYGEESLPLLKDLVSDTPDPEKDLILDYLRTNCAVVSPGIVRDLLNPEETIGDGSIYQDDLYDWPDVLPVYVEKYNIRLPEDFREHILNTYETRKRDHLKLRLTDCVKIHNNPYFGCYYNISISRNGTVRYSNNIGSNGLLSPKITLVEETLQIRPDDACYTIDPIMTDLFCYDEKEHGRIVMDGYHWEISFYDRNHKLLKKTEGRYGESDWRRNEFARIIRFVERVVLKDMGSRCMWNVEEP